MEITKQNGDMCFNEEFHKYWNVSKPSASFISVTTLIGKFEQPFDEEFWSTYKAIERILDSNTWKQAKKVLLETHKITQNFLDLYDLDKSEIESVQQDILDEWSKTNRESCERGTKIHLNLENSLYKGGKKLTLDKYGLGGVFECRKNYNNFDLENGVYPEYLIHWSSEDGMLNIAGQIDCLVKQGNTIHIIDWKTNKEIKLKSGFDTKTKQTIKMKYPLNTLEDCNYQHYTLQLSTYAWMIQQINPNFIIGRLKLVHFDHNDKMAVYDIEYKKDEVIKMLKYYKHKVIKDEQLARIAPLKY